LRLNCAEIEDGTEQTVKKFWQLDSLGQQQPHVQDTISAQFNANAASKARPIETQMTDTDFPMFRKWNIKYL
ncbi:hypothetical protein T4E_718, partial [Trichinella pseudospiralis]